MDPDSQLICKFPLGFEKWRHPTAARVAAEDFLGSNRESPRVVPHPKAISSPRCMNVKYQNSHPDHGPTTRRQVVRASSSRPVEFQAVGGLWFGGLRACDGTRTENRLSSARTGVVSACSEQAKWELRLEFCVGRPRSGTDADGRFGSGQACGINGAYKRPS
jgi:hypothetical protein